MKNRASARDDEKGEKAQPVLKEIKEASVEERGNILW